jgi:hypothetical protein
MRIRIKTRGVGDHLHKRSIAKLKSAEDAEMGNTNNDAALFSPTSNVPPILPDNRHLGFEQTWTSPEALDSIFTTGTQASAGVDATFPEISWNNVDFAAPFRTLTDSSTEIADLLDPLSASRGDPSVTDTLSQPASAIESTDTTVNISSDGSSTPSSKHTLVLQNAEPHTVRNILDILYKDRVRYKLDVDQ